MKLHMSDIDWASKFSLELDIPYYKRAYPELSILPDEIAAEHWSKFAERDGRTSCPYDRSEYLKEMLREQFSEAKILEIGCFDNPFCNGPNVKYFEVMDADALRRRSKELNRPFHDIPDRIDYVDPNANLGIVKEQFDIVFSSHVIEHQTDLIRHLQNVERILEDRGLYIMFIPDKRYCFDHFLPEARLSEIVDAYHESRKLHPLQKVVEHYSMTTHNDAVQHWLGHHGVCDTSRARVAAAIQEYESKPGQYIDVHESQYTPDSFRNIIYSLNKLGFTGLSVFRCCHTVFGRFEFCAILIKSDGLKKTVNVHNRGGEI